MAHEPDKSSWFYNKNLSVLSIFNLMQERLSKCNKDAAHLLILLSYYGPYIIPMKLLDQVKSLDVPLSATWQGFHEKLKWLIDLSMKELPLQTAVTQLEKFSLLKSRKIATESIISFSVHNFVCRWRSETLESSDREDWAILAAYVLSR